MRIPAALGFLAALAGCALDYPVKLKATHDHACPNDQMKSPAPPSTTSQSAAESGNATAAQPTTGTGTAGSTTDRSFPTVTRSAARERFADERDGAR